MASDICLPVQVAAVKDGVTVNDLSMALGFFVGVIVGALVAFLCAKLCARDINRATTKRQDIEGVAHVTVYTNGGFVGQQNYKQGQGQGQVQVKQPVVSKRKKSVKKPKPKQYDDLDGEPSLPAPIISLPQEEPRGGDSGKSEETPHQGLIDVLLEDQVTDKEDMVAEQEISALNDLDKDITEENMTTMIQMMRTMLKRQLEKGKVTPEQAKELMEKMQESIEEGIRKSQREREEAEEELKKKKFRDPNEREREVERIRSKFMQALNSIIPNEKNRLRKQLSCQTELSETEIDAMMEELTENMATLEKKLGQDRLRQTAKIEERLARRRQLLEKQDNESQQLHQEVALRIDVNHNVISTLVDEGKLLGRQKDELLAQYKDDMDRLHKVRQEEAQKQKLALAEKLRKSREERMRRLEREHEKEREDFARKADKFTETADVVESYHNLLEEQRRQQNETVDALDYEEAGKIETITKEQNEKLAQDMNNTEEEFQKKLLLKAQLSESDSKRIMKLHKQEMQEMEKLKKAEKKRMKAKLEERLAERRKKAEDNKQKMIMEQEALKEQQDATIGKLLSSQHELNDEAKQQIMKEHEQNMAAINNHLASSKLRQQKLLEQRLNKRRAKVTDLKRKGEDLKMMNKHVKNKASEKEQQNLEKQIAAEEKSLVEEKKKATKELRERVAEETEQLLKEQDKRLGLLIARLQVGQARRQNTIQKQDNAIKELEAQLASRVVEGGDKKSDSQVNTVLKQHQRQVEELGERMESDRNRQQQLLQERIEAKKHQKERQIEDHLEMSAQEELEQQRRRGAGLATSILSQSLLEQRHKMAMLQLEKEMTAEMQKQRELLNREHEEDLQRELIEHKKSFLSQLAAISNMSKDEVTRLVSEVVTDSGGSNKEAKKLAKELKTGMEHAKTDMALDEEDEEGYSYSSGSEDEDDRDKRRRRRR